MLTALIIYILGWGLLHSYIQIVLWKNGIAVKASLDANAMINDFIYGKITFLQLYKWLLTSDHGWRNQIWNLNKFLGALAYATIVFTPIDIIAYIAIAPILIATRVKYKSTLAMQ